MPKLGVDILYFMNLFFLKLFFFKFNFLNVSQEEKMESKLATILFGLILIMTASPAPAAEERFVAVDGSGGEVMKDSETGLWWLTSVLTTRDANWNEVPAPQDWQSAKESCAISIFAGRGGWRVPSKREVYTLPDYKNGGEVYSFRNLSPGEKIWTSDTDPDMPEYAIAADLSNAAGPGDFFISIHKNDLALTLCAR